MGEDTIWPIVYNTLSEHGTSTHGPGPAPKQIALNSINTEM